MSNISPEQLAKHLYETWRVLEDKTNPLTYDEEVWRESTHFGETPRAVSTALRNRPKPRQKWYALNSLEQDVWVKIARSTLKFIEYNLPISDFE